MDPKIEDLLLHWRDCREKGQTISAKELCANCPELQAELERRIQVVTAMERWLGMGSQSEEASDLPLHPPSARTVSSTESPLNGEALPAPLRFHAPGYELVAVLDQGGMGIVYKARQSRLKRLVALKTIRADLHLKPRQLARFR